MVASAKEEMRTSHQPCHKMHPDSANSAQKTSERPSLSASICLVDGEVPVQPAAAVARKSNEEQWPLSTVSRGDHNAVNAHEERDWVGVCLCVNPSIF